MKNIFIITILMFIVTFVGSNADLLDCEERILPATLSDIGPKISRESEEHLAGFFKKWGCHIKRGASKLGEDVKEGAKKLREGVREGAKKLKEKTENLGSKIATKFHDIKDHLSKDSDESFEIKHKLFADNVEIVNPDILKGDQLCGHGHILDALGNCSKLRK
ncbi:uncharacterized protein LOC119638440 [Glossina fuscipes]|uniref:Uncharacterized protein LOC119638440 n=2 Tax=Nemorhina TaxID=44051 RepID=A0A9C5Z389_9MUSC|nr:uncharacterized protein LOC119638440 [Glossina fuscipes]